MAQTTYEKLLVAWGNLQRQVNTKVPNGTDRVWASRNKLAPPSSGGGPKPS